MCSWRRVGSRLSEQAPIGLPSVDPLVTLILGDVGDFSFGPLFGYRPLCDLTVRVINFSSQNCIQADIQSASPLHHMNLDVLEKLIGSLRGLSRSTDRLVVSFFATTAE